MPWELHILPSDGSGSLGTVDHVQAKLRTALPEIEFVRDAGGPEKLAAMESQGVEVPDVIREHWHRSTGEFQGVIEGDGFSMEFHLGEDDSNVVAVGIDVRGTGDPMPVLRRLTNIDGWKLLDPQGQPPTAASWESFAAWRDDAIRDINDEA